ncbi:fumarylacetoacetate hydrolase family protein [Dongia deserti]|uniref:fumarylacetoacetate hydrolase family protein n=1 Tax=Dongia deserti TaxID=2268030 RepID=UPI000E650CF9|nr:fumarylacetoacetate hydrolase family protein [Dongia deserti]
MKLATLKMSGRDGRLHLVSRDLTRCVAARDATTLQQALDSWAVSAPMLEEEARGLEAGEWLGVEEFVPEQCAAPLPRAYQWADGSAYVNHVELVRKARGAEMPPSFWTDPLMYQGGSDSFLGPRDPIQMADEAWGIDFEAEIAVITDDVPMGVGADEARSHIKLLMLVNDVSLRNLIPGELAKGFGFFQSKPSSAFSPVAVTPDELGAAWGDGKVHLPLITHLNGQPFGRPNAGIDMTFDFGQLIAHAARTRPLAAGTIVGSGTISNKGADGGPGRPVSEGGAGYSCIAEQRTVETLLTGSPKTPFMKFGDRVRIEMLGANSNSLFGAIEQEVVRYQRQS